MGAGVRPNAARTRTAERGGASALRSDAAEHCRTGRVRTSTGERRTVARATRCASPLLARYLPGALVQRRTTRRAQGHVAASARAPLHRPKQGDSRSPDRTSVTPGFLCRSGYTSPTIAQSVVLTVITSILQSGGGVKVKSLGPGYQRAKGLRISRVSSKPIVEAKPNPKYRFARSSPVLSVQ